MGMLKTILLLILFLVIIPLFIIVFFYKIYFDKTQEFVFSPNMPNDLPDNLPNATDANISLGPNPSDFFPNGITFYDNIRFKRNNISYSVSQDCNLARVNDSREAFKILQDSTILKFYEAGNNANAEINIYCSEKIKEMRDNYFVAGEGGPDFMINTSEYNVIVNGTVLLYKDNACDNPIVAIHEILHVIGFRHSTDKNSVLYTASDCKQEITKDIIDEINYLYKDSTLPDLKFTQLTAKRQGAFLNFESEIKNTGLLNAENVSLSLYAGANLINKYNLGNIDLGEGKIFRVSNLMFLRQSSNLTFIIDDKNQIPEINKENNIANLILAS